MCSLSSLSALSALHSHRVDCVTDIYISEVGKSEQSESNREIGFGSVALALRCEAVWARAGASVHQVIFPGLEIFQAKVLPRVVPRRGAHHFARRGGVSIHR